MSLAATLAAEGMRPASMLPSIKCSNCGDEIEISAMGDHICGKAPEPQKAAPASINPFTLRAMNASGTKPVQPSPLQFNSPPTTQTRQRAPTLGSKPPRPAPPRINADVANQPFLAPLPRTETPISPASSTHSGSGLASRPGPSRSMTNPRPRIFDPRPPSPELSANLDCAFPPFPVLDSISSRPSTSSGRRTPTASERSSSRAESRHEMRPSDAPRQDVKLSDLTRQLTKSPERSPQETKPQDASLRETKSSDTSSLESKASQASSGQSMFGRMLNRMNTFKSGPSDSTRRRPSNDERQQQERMPLDRRRPSLSVKPPIQEAPLLSATFATDSPREPHMDESSMGQTMKPSMPASQQAGEKKVPPGRPARPPTEDLSPDFLDTLSAEPVSPITSTSPPLAPPPLSIRTTDRSNTFPRVEDGKDDMNQRPSLSKMRSEPALGHSRTATATSEPLQVPQALPPRGQSRNDARIDYRLQDAPPVPKPVQLHRSNSMHRPSGSDSSTASSVNSLRNTNSSSGTSPLTSAASSVDALSPLAQELKRQGEERAARAASSNAKNLEPGLRAEQPRQRAPPRTFTRPSPTEEVKQSPMPPPTIPAANKWPLESPTDPAMQNGRLGAVGQRAVSPISTDVTTPKTVAPEPDISPITFDADDYDPYRPPKSPQFPRSQQSDHGPAYTPADYSLQPKVYEAPSRSKPKAPQRAVSSQTERNVPRSRAQSPPPVQALSVPQDASRPQLTRRTTSGGKPICRGCNLQIEGKSVKAADGRLTGRWHKACFVCKTCQEPFTTADFYVIKNNPYCEQHYHEKNGSLCHGCRRGIEGQYLETTSSSPRGTVDKKYHPRCFTCFDCRMVLSDDYFEIQGRVFCERHALAAMRAQRKPSDSGSAVGPPGRGLTPPTASNLRAERRTTKLMMMV